MNGVLKAVVSYTFATLSGVCLVGGVAVLARG